MILSDESPILRLPSGLSVPLIQLLDGIRYGIVMADLSFERLVFTLSSIFGPDSERPPTHRLAAATFLDAWSMIDAVNRLRKLLPEAYRKDRTPALEPFFAETEAVRVLRNSIQHAEERIQSAEPFPLPGTPPVWGTIECLAPGGDHTSARYASLTPGTRTFKWAQSAIAGVAYPKAPVDHIAITAFGVELSLSAIHVTVDKLARGLEAVAPKVGPEFSFSDVLMVHSVPYELISMRRGFR